MSMLWKSSLRSGYRLPCAAWPAPTYAEQPHPWPVLDLNIGYRSTAMEALPWDPIIEPMALRGQCRRSRSCLASTSSVFPSTTRSGKAACYCACYCGHYLTVPSIWSWLKAIASCEYGIAAAYHAICPSCHMQVTCLSQIVF